MSEKMFSPNGYDLYQYKTLLHLRGLKFLVPEGYRLLTCKLTCSSAFASGTGTALLRL